MLGLGMEKLAPLPDVAWGIRLETLRRRVAADLAAIGRGDEIVPLPQIELAA
jgi:hypothetical protein